MKTIIQFLVIMGLALTFNPIKTIARSSALKEIPVVSKEAEALQANALYLRLEEIKMISQKNLTKAEKENLNKEVKAIKNNLQHLGGGVYISVGGLILILILLIILV